MSVAIQAEPLSPHTIYTVEQIAEYLGVTPGALRYQIHKGTAPKSGKLMGRRVFRGCDVIAFVEAAFEEATR